MKNLTQTALLLLMLSLTFFSGCNQDDELTAELLPQLAETACADLSTSDLDLSPGFRGSYTKNTDPELPDFSIRRHDNEYDFPESAEAGGCNGYCSFQVVFEPAGEGMSAPTENIEVASVSVSYEDASVTVNEPVVSWTWSYPYLTVEVVYVNAITDYAVDFASDFGNELNVADIVVLGGLCVIENVDGTDPVRRIQLNDIKFGGN